MKISCCRLNNAYFLDEFFLKRYVNYGKCHVYLSIKIEVYLADSYILGTFFPTIDLNAPLNTIYNLVV